MDNHMGEFWQVQHGSRFIQLLLDEQGAMLVLRKLHHMVGQVT